MSTIESTAAVASPPHLEQARDQLHLALAAARSKVLELEAVRELTAECVRALPREELRAMLDLIIVAKHADHGLEWLLQCGVLSAVLPELCAMVGFGDEHYHKDIWKHTKRVVVQTVPRTHIRWAALFHDVGKVKTRSFGPAGKVQFLGHPEVGARMFDKLCRRTRLFSDEPERQAIRFLVLHHQRISQYEDEWTDSAVRRFAREIGEHLEDLFLLCRADITTKHKEKKRRYLADLKLFQKRIQKLQEEDAQVPPLPGGIGDAIMLRFGLRPGKLVGTIKKELEAQVEAGELPKQAEPEVYLAALAADLPRYGLG